VRRDRHRGSAALLAALVAAGPLLAQEPGPAEEAEPPATPPPASTPAAPAAAPLVPAVPRISFEVQFPPENGGGTAAGSAGSLEYQGENLAIATGGVEIRYQDYTVKAERVTLDRSTMQLTAEGGVVLDQGPRRLSGRALHFDLETKTGSLSEAVAFVEPDYYFRGEEIAKVGEDIYTVRAGAFTSCAGEVPDWSFRLARARVELEGYARLRHATLRVKRVPVFYLPYILWPAKSERTSGLLIPNLGYSRRRGGYLGLAYYQVLGRSYDTTLFVDLYGERYYGVGDEFRYRPSEGTRGRVRGYLIDDPLSVDYRWKLSFEHETTDLPWNMRGVVAYEDFSDFDFFRDFERDLDQSSLRTLYSSGFVTGNWGPHSLNLLLDDRQTFIDQGEIIRQRQLPEIEYRLRATKLGGTPLYLQLLSSVNYLMVERSATNDGDYGRADLFPQLSLPVRTVPWLTLALSAGGRATYYSDSLDGSGAAFAGESLTRVFPTAGAEIVGPSVSRIFDAKLGGFAKLKHVIEPRWTYSYLGEIDEPERVPLFDEVDTPRVTNLARVALVNRVLAKPADASRGGAREILSFELAQAYSLDGSEPLQRSRDGQRVEAWGPLQALLRFNSGPGTNLKAQLNYSTLFDGLESTSLSGNLGVGRHQAGLTWFTRYDAESGETRGDQLGVNLGVELVPRRLRLDAQVNYDLEDGLLQQQRYVADYASQCWGVRFEFREFRAIDRRDRDYRFALTLKNVGTFLDMTGGQRQEF